MTVCRAAGIRWNNPFALRGSDVRSPSLSRPLCPSLSGAARRDPVNDRRLGAHHLVIRRHAKPLAAEAAARAELADVQQMVNTETYVHTSSLTVDTACEAWLLSKHDLKPSTLVKRVAGDPKTYRTLTAAEINMILSHDSRDRHLWELALCGLRRGEIAGLRWSSVNLTDEVVGNLPARSVRIAENGSLWGT